MLFFFSTLLGKPVLDQQGEKVATLKDLIVRINPEIGKSEEAYPPVAGLLAQTANREFWLPAHQIQDFDRQGVKLHSARLSLERYQRRDGEILLYRDVLDKQLVDVEGRRVIRVNDLALGHVTNENFLRLLAVDISFQALMRRIFSFPFRRASKPSTPAEPSGPRSENLLDWADVQYFASSAPTVRLNVSHEKLGRLHPADVARLLNELSYVQSAEVVNALSDELAADILEEMEADDAADVLEGLSADRAADILEEMEADDAADVLAEVEDPEQVETWLDLMEPAESNEVRELLAYGEDSAGGIMNNDFLMLPANLDTRQALRSIREMEYQPEFVDYVYVVEPASKILVGVAALRDLVFCPVPETPLNQLMQTDFVSVHPDTPAENAAALLSEYGFRALPVLNGASEILGIITFDDALDLILPEDLRRRIPKIYQLNRSVA